ncbi:MAG TPA: hypothetical protein DCS68_09945, partial [Pantoea agglomerans]|nr:hypothetical protein [Pantoea agglomerans]
MLTINHNETAAITNKTRYSTDSVLGRTVERLSSGMRINSAKDDAAGQAIANRMTANINAGAEVARGLNDAISYSTNARGRLCTIVNISLHAATPSGQDGHATGVWGGTGGRHAA